MLACAARKSRDSTPKAWRLQSPRTLRKRQRLLKPPRRNARSVSRQSLSASRCSWLSSSQSLDLARTARRVMQKSNRQPRSARPVGSTARSTSGNLELDYRPINSRGPASEAAIRTKAVNLPLHSLALDPEMLSSESIRTFCDDNNWIYFLDGIRRAVKMSNNMYLGTPIDGKSICQLE
ncbi:hypothetical protein NM208_g8285 [Fusarium decemcellulare]|uniref:Uncharacterized protein n=1 Tax=Fusarium decemcellulare TaxID=57161 RepID=A0ACC1S669_9HYPO|nr:hypothetical protein NM208_g8285 [Fusarium decemcellulare]